MKSNYKMAQQRKFATDLTRANLKLFLVALMRSEGFGKDRLYRVLYEFCSLVANESYETDEMLMVDKIIESKMGKDFILNIGREKLNF